MAPRILQSVLALCTAAALFWNIAYVTFETVKKPWEFLFSDAPLQCEITEGPWRGLYTNEAVRRFYNDMLADLDTIKAANPGRAPVCVLSLFPVAYLYMDLPYGAYSAWYEYDEPERLAAYWQLRPAQQPAFIYVPYYDMYSYGRLPDDAAAAKLSGIERFVSGEHTEGRAGCIIRVTELHLPDTPEA